MAVLIIGEPHFRCAHGLVLQCNGASEKLTAGGANVVFRDSKTHVAALVRRRIGIQQDIPDSAGDLGGIRYLVRAFKGRDIIHDYREDELRELVFERGIVQQAPCDSGNESHSRNTADHRHNNNEHRESEEEAALSGLLGGFRFNIGITHFRYIALNIRFLIEPSEKLVDHLFALVLDRRSDRLCRSRGVIFFLFCHNTLPYLRTCPLPFIRYL